jgi:hypothetical protein
MQASNEYKVEMNISFLKGMNYHAATFIKCKDDMIMLRTPGPAFDSFFYLYLAFTIFILRKRCSK